MSDPPIPQTARLQTLIDLTEANQLVNFNISSAIRNALTSSNTGESVPDILDRILPEISSTVNGIAYAMGTHRDSWAALLAFQQQIQEAQAIHTTQLAAISNALGLIAGAIGSIVPPDDTTVRAWLQGIYNNQLQQIARVGDPNNPGVNTVLGKLTNIAECACSTPGTPDSRACNAPFESDGFVISSTASEVYELNGVLATWPDPLPANVGRTFVTYDIPNPERVEIASSVWSAFYIFVQSSAPYFRFTPDAGSEAYPTGQWVQVPGGLGVLAVWVEPGNSIQATLCRDSDYEIEYGNSGCNTVAVPSAIGNEITVMISNPNNKVGTIKALAGRLPVFIHSGFILGQDTTGVPATATLTTVGQVWSYPAGVDNVGLTVGPNEPGSVEVCFAE